MNIYSEVYNIVCQIPKGYITTYKYISKALGDDSFYVCRVIGKILNENPYSEVPCHRVVNSNGTVGDYKDGFAKKIELLRNENIKLLGQKILNFEKLLYKDFKCSNILKKLQDIQKKISNKIILEDKFSEINTVGGVDVSYKGNLATVGYAKMDIKNGTNYKKRITTEVNFLYIPTYLTFRELPAIRKILVCEKQDILFINGNGILHPKKCGLATHLGVILNIPTIGVTKKLLCGEYKLPKEKLIAEVTYNDEVLGYCVKRPEFKEIFISPGNKISPHTALNITLKFLKNYRLPEPLYIADKITKYVL